MMMMETAQKEACESAGVAVVGRMMRSVERVDTIGGKINQCFQVLPFDRLGQRLNTPSFDRFTTLEKKLQFFPGNDVADVLIMPQVADPFPMRSPAHTPQITEPVVVEEASPVTYWIEYSERSRRVMLNGDKQLARLNFNSTNELVFDYLYRNQGKRVTVKELEAEVLKEPLNKTLHAIVRDLGFTGALGQMFFDVSKSAIRFSNHVTEADLEAFDISPDSILPH
jgi:hypothetical protein